MTHFECRRFRAKDMPALVDFFRQSYGGQTVFQDPEFLRWYFSGALDGGLESLVAVDDAGAVVAHYGGLPCMLQLHGRALPMVWGANAYTLPEWRSRGIGQKLVDMMMERYEVFGIVGFSPKTADFYHAAGFNVFSKRRFHRFALALQPSAHELAERIGMDRVAAESRFPLAAVSHQNHGACEPKILPLDSAGAWTQSAPEVFAAASTRRDAEFLARRFARNPFVAYTGHFAPAGGYIVTRSERLYPTEHRALRIVDMRATGEAAVPLLKAVVREGMAEGASYLDFACAGPEYDAAFASLGFTALREDDAALLPQVTSPVEARPNHEYFGLFSRSHHAEIAALTADDVYFTRADSDRDRIARLSQRFAV